MGDLLQGVQDAVVAGSGDDGQDFKMPSTEELLAAIEQMTGLSEEQKKELVEGIVTGKGPGGGAGIPGMGGLPSEPAAARSVSLEVAWMLSLLSIVFLVLVFFGYKLYKSLVDRERRREEKKRQKLQKKKK